MNWVESVPPAKGSEAINTSLYSVVNFLCHLFCYIEVEYCEEFLYMIRKMHGLTYREKYRRISKGLPYEAPKNPPVIDESVFLDFINENVIDSSLRTAGAMGSARQPTCVRFSRPSTSTWKSIDPSTRATGSSSPGR